MAAPRKSRMSSGPGAVQMTVEARGNAASQPSGSKRNGEWLHPSLPERR